MFWESFETKFGRLNKRSTKILLKKLGKILDLPLLRYPRALFVSSSSFEKGMNVKNCRSCVLLMCMSSYYF